MTIMGEKKDELRSLLSDNVMKNLPRGFSAQGTSSADKEPKESIKLKNLKGR